HKILPSYSSLRSVYVRERRGIPPFRVPTPHKTPLIAKVSMRTSSAFVLGSAAIAVVAIGCGSTQTTPTPTPTPQSSTTRQAPPQQQTTQPTNPGEPDETPAQGGGAGRGAGRGGAGGAQQQGAANPQPYARVVTRQAQT